LFLARKSMEVILSGVDEEFLGEKDIQRFPGIEILMNIMLFHVDILIRPKDKKNDETCSRWIFSELGVIFSILDTYNANDITVSLQSRRYDNADNEYHISNIEQIYKNADPKSLSKYIIYCKNGKVYGEFGIYENEVSNGELIYKSKNRSGIQR